MSWTRWACAGAFAAAFGGVQAQTLAATLEAASRHDPQFQAARAELEAAQQLLPLARAARLPSVSATVADAKVDGTRETPGLLGPVRSSLDYRSPNYALNVRIPLLNPEAWHRERGAQARVEQAEQVFKARLLELLDRTATAWLNLHRAERLAALAAEPTQAAAAVAEQARNQLTAGETAQTDVADAQAALAQATALEASARSAVALARLALDQLLGGPGQSTADASPPAAASTPGAARPDLPASWPGMNESVQEAIARAKASHPALAARRQAVLAAAADIRRNEAGHLPRADLVLSASTSRNESLSTLNQAVNQRVLSAQLNLPLYSGGQVVASVAQAAAELRRAEAELMAEEQTIEREVTRLHLALGDQARRWQAQQQAVEAAQLGVRAATLAQRENLATRADVQQSQRRLAQEQQTLVGIAHEGALAWVRLRAQQGEDPQRIATTFDDWLRAPAR